MAMAMAMAMAKAKAKARVKFKDCGQVPGMVPGMQKCHGFEFGQDALTSFTLRTEKYLRMRGRLEELVTLFCEVDGNFPNLVCRTQELNYCMLAALIFIMKNNGIR